jgi:iron-sulfur cluster repair protein YtfE (RIC family)
MDALTLLTEQHEEVDGLIEEIEAADDAETKRALFEEMADRLAAHASVEEKLFYPAVKREETQERLLESVEEHLSIKRILADMLALDVEDDVFDAKLSVLKEELEHHAHEEEEKELFPIVKKMMKKQELEELGAQMEELFEELLAEEPRNQVPSETESAAPIE